MDAYFALTAVHIYTNWRAMKTLALRSLNLERSQLLIKGFLSHLPRDAFDSCHLHRNSTEIEAVFQNSGDLSLSHVGRNEPIMKPFLPSYLRPKERVILNSDIATVLSNVDIDILKNSIHHYREEEFIICSSRDSQTIHILMKTGCASIDRLRALFEGHVMASSGLPSNPRRESVSSLFRVFLRLITQHGWDIQRISLTYPRAKSYSVVVE